MLKRINKEQLPKSLKDFFNTKPTNKTINLADLITLADYLVEERRQQNILKVWVNNHILKKDFCEWKQKQVNNAPSKNLQKLTINFFELLNNINNTGIKKELLTTYIMQNTQTKEISLNYTKIHINFN